MTVRGGGTGTPAPARTATGLESRDLGPDPDRFREALAHFPSGVVIVTTRSDTRTPHGFTASSFCAVSLEPPLVSVCLARAARCHPAFGGSDQFTVNVLRPGHVELARRFARSTGDKFEDGSFRCTERGTMVLDDALAVLECAAYARHEAGDHTILVGEVRRVDVTPGDPLLFFRRAFQRLMEPV